MFKSLPGGTGSDNMSAAGVMGRIRAFGSCGMLGVTEERPGKAIVEGIASAVVENPIYWRCQDYWMITKASSSSEVEPA